MRGIMIRMSIEVTHFEFICTIEFRGINRYQRVRAFDCHENWTDNGSIEKEMNSKRKSEIKSISSYCVLIKFSANDYELLQFDWPLPFSDGGNLDDIYLFVRGGFVSNFSGRLPSSGGQNLNDILRELVEAFVLNFERSLS